MVHIQLNERTGAKDRVRKKVLIMKKPEYTFLYMHSKADLRPSALIPGLRLRKVPNKLHLVRPMHDRVAEPYRWSGLEWSKEKWIRWLSKRTLENLVIEIDDNPTGIASMYSDQEDSVKICIFGLFPEFIGRGYGGYALTLTVEHAWQMKPVDKIARVWLRTSSMDHPHALPNYLQRGFTPASNVRV
jgi:hypothetical protein